MTPPRPDEIALAREVLANDGHLWHRWVGSTYTYPASPPRREEYVLGKWCDKGWWEFGNSIRTGWITSDGEKALRAMVGGE